MPRVNRLVRHEQYVSYLEKIKLWEENRVFCKHGFAHGLAVARIAYVYLLENGAGEVSKECVYAAALLHDIGRWAEYETGEDHAGAGAVLALPLLEACGFQAREIRTILTGIREHRRHEDGDLSLLGKALALADNWARDCLQCTAQDLCSKYQQEMCQIIY